MERPVRMVGQLLVALVVPIGRQEERLGVADVDRDGEAERTGLLPHRIEAWVVHLHERAVLAGRVLVAQEQAQRLEHLHAHRAGGLRRGELVGLPLRVIGALRLGPRRFGEGQEPPGMRAIEPCNCASESLTLSAGEVDHRADVAGVHHLQQVGRWHRPPRLPRVGLRAADGQMRVHVDDWKRRLLDHRHRHVQHALRLVVHQLQRRVRLGCGLPAPAPPRRAGRHPLALLRRWLPSRRPSPRRSSSATRVCSQVQLHRG